MIQQLTPAHEELVTKEYLRAELIELESRIGKRFSLTDQKITKSQSDTLKFLLLQTVAIMGLMVALFQMMPH